MGRVPFDEHTLLAALKSVEHIPKAPLRLTEDKSCFPKMLCFDMNQWIYLGRAYYGKNDRLQPALQAIRHAIEKGKLVVPILNSNLEFVQTENTPAKVEQRERLATFMVELSGNYSLLPAEVITNAEIANAVAMHYGLPALQAVRSNLLHWGIQGAVGKKLRFRSERDDVDSFLNTIMMSPVMSVLLITHASNDGAVGFRASEEETARVVARVREIDSRLTMEERRRREYTTLKKGRHGLMAMATVLTLNKDCAAFVKWLERDDNIVQFFAMVPQVDVMGTLMLARDRNRQQKTHRNDRLDLAFLQVALPYGNLVVGERSWRSLSKSTKLCDRYQTTFISDLTCIERELKQLGCL